MVVNCNQSFIVDLDLTIKDIINLEIEPDLLIIVPSNLKIWCLVGVISYKKKITI